MKKYFLKISGLATIAIPLVTMVACTSKDTKDTTTATTTTALTMEQVKAKFVDVTSTKSKDGDDGIVLPTGDDKSLTAEVMGYTVPEGIEGFEVKYALKTTWGTGDKLDKFKVTVTITKGDKTATKDIWITAVYDFTSVKGKFLDASTSSKTRIDLVDVVGKEIDAEVTAAQMGYTQPVDADLDGVVVKYKITEVLSDTDDTDNKFKVNVILSKTIGTTTKTAKKEIEITAKAMPTIANAKELVQDAESTKWKSTITLPTGADKTLKAEDIGYNPPVLSGVVIDKLELLLPTPPTGDALKTKEGIDMLKGWVWGTTPETSLAKPKFKVKVFLKKGTEVDTKEIWIKAKAIEIFKKEVIVARKAIKEGLKPSTPSNDRMTKVNTYWKKVRLLKEAKELLEKAKREQNKQFATNLALFKDVIILKKKSALWSSLVEKGTISEDSILTDANLNTIGYTPPTLTGTGVSATYRLKDKSMWETEGKIKIGVTLKELTDYSQEKEITIKYEWDEEDLNSIKTMLGAKYPTGLQIVLPSDTSGTILNYKAKIEKKLREIIGRIYNFPSTRDESENLDGQPTTNAAIASIYVQVNDITIEVVGTDSTIAVHTPVSIIVKLKKGTNEVSIDIFNVVKRARTTTTTQDDIQSIKTLLSAKYKPWDVNGKDDESIIKLPSRATGTILSNKASIEQELRKIITKDRYGDARNNRLKSVNILVDMKPTIRNLPISTTPQEIIVVLEKYGTKVSMSARFKVRRESTQTESSDDILTIKSMLDALPNKDIALLSDTTGSISDSKETIAAELRKLLAGVGTQFKRDLQMLGVTISIVENNNAITSTLQDISIKLTKLSGTVQTVNGFKVKADNELALIKEEFEKMTGNKLIINLPTTTTGKISNNVDEIKSELRKLITGDDIGAKTNPKMKGVKIYSIASWRTDSDIDATPQKIVITLKKDTDIVITMEDGSSQTKKVSKTLKISPKFKVKVA